MKYLTWWINVEAGEGTNTHTDNPPTKPRRGIQTINGQGIPSFINSKDKVQLTFILFT